MGIKKWTSLLAAVLAAWPTTAFAYQKVDLPGIKPPAKKEQLAPVEFITAEELKSKIAKNESVAIVDLRSQSSFGQSDKTIKGSLHSKVRKVAHQLRELPRDREIVTYCACPSDEAAALAARELLANGFKRVRVLKGGWSAWIEAAGQVQPKPKV